MYPDPSTIAQMVTDLVVSAGWETFTILYETPEWLPNLSNLLELNDPKGFTVTIRRLDVGLTIKDFRAILRRVKVSSDTHILLECSVDSLNEILKQAQQIGIMIDKYQYIITNLDAHTIDLEPYQYSGANITLIQMVDTSHDTFTEYNEYLKKTKAAEEEEEEAKKEGEEGKESEENVEDPFANNNEPPAEEENPDENNEEESTGEKPADEENGEEEKKPEDETEAEAEGGLCQLKINYFNFLI